MSLNSNEEKLTNNMIKTYILDTNVLLSDGNALFSFEEHNVVLPLIVLEELDRHKDRQDEVGRNARETVRKLTELTKENAIKLSEGISRGNGLGWLKVLSNQDVCVEEIKFPSELVTMSSGDNTIAKFCIAYIKTHSDEPVSLVTRDLVLQVKCSVLGIKWENYRKFNVISSANTLYSGCKTITDFDVQKFYADQENFVLDEETIKENALVPNEFVILTNQSASAVAQFKNSKSPLKPIKKYSYGKFSARNKEQEFAMQLLLDDSVKLVTLVGSAGTGKTLLALAAGLEQVIGTKKTYKNLVVCRPVQSVGKDIGFLPGTLEEKMEPWIAPIKDNLRFLVTEGKKGKFNDQILQEYFDNGIIEVEAMTFIRGRSIANAFMIIDESQNLNAHELKTIITRVGENTKIVLTGDIEQIDASNLDSVSNGLTICVEKFKESELSGHILLKKGERSALATLASKCL